MDSTIRVETLSLKIPANKPVSIGPKDDEEVRETLQITNVALGPDPSSARHTVWCECNGSKWVVGTLQRSIAEQFLTDLMTRQELVFSHTGDGDVYISGFKTATVMELFDDDVDDEDEEEDEDEEDDDEEDDDDVEDEEAAQAVAVQNGRAVNGLERLVDKAAGKAGKEVAAALAKAVGKKPGKAARALQPDVKPVDDDADDDDDDVEEEEDDDDDDDEDVVVHAQEFSEMELEEDDDDDDDDEVEEDDDDEDEDDDDDEEEEEEEEVKPAPPAAKPAGKKRSVTALAPAPVAAVKAEGRAAKKSKVEDAAGGSAGAADAVKYEKELQKALKDNGGTMPLSNLGSKVKKPDSMKAVKFKKFLEERPQLFKVSGNDVVLVK